MIRFRSLYTAFAVVLLSLAAVFPAAAQMPVEVSITNLTRGQVIPPPLVISHNDDYQLFAIGQPAGADLAALAQDGDTMPLEAQLATLPEVFDFGVGGGVILPGMTMTVTIDAGRQFRQLTIAAMLASSNDAFLAVRGLQLSPRGSTVYALAYDSGSEGNAELCDHIPGPPCGNKFVANDDGAEGYVHVHAGIHGIGELAAADLDWRNPVALIEIHPVP